MHLSPRDLDLIVYDFDGVMTDNRVYVSQSGDEAVSCNRSDGLAVGMIRGAGVPQLIISTEVNEVVSARARKLGLDVIQACDDKAQSLAEFCDNNNYNLSRVLYVGNDVNDLAAMRLAGYPVSPSDGHPSIRSMAKIVVSAPGGAGVIRELADRLLANGAQAAAAAAPAAATGKSCDDLVAQVRAALADAVKLREELMRDDKMLESLCALSRTIARTIQAGGKVIFAGNGGSFADAQHLAAEFVGRFMRERSPLAGVCLGTNSSTVTAIGNDYRFDDIFVRELQAVARPGDVFIPISTSGNSGNLIEAIRAAQAMGLTTCALVGKGGGRIAPMCDSIVVPSQHTARIQEIHITLGHIVCGLVDDLLDAAKQ
jgi:D-sedoheptulose 7-phosphate isomerase